MRRHRLIALAVTSLVLATAACSGSSDKKSSAASMSTAAASSAAESAPSAGASAPVGAPDSFAGDGQNVQAGPGASESAQATAAAGKGGAPIVRGRVATGREDIIKNAALTIEAKDVDRARNDAVAQAEALGADISSESRAGTGDNKSATIVFRVLPADFDDLVTALGKLGEVVSTKTTTEDVTGQVADIEGRIRAARDSAEKIRALIARAEKITDLVTLEREFESRDAEIQSMASQLASLKDRAGRSTVTLSIGPVSEKPKPPAKPKKRETGFIGGLKAGWDAFAATTVVFATALGALLPFLALALMGLIGWWIVRRRRPVVVKPTLEAATPYGTPPS